MPGGRSLRRSNKKSPVKLSTHERPLGMKRAPLITALLLIVGCSQDFILSNATPSYADGYRAGCQTGTGEASNISRTVVRDEKRYQNEPDYQNGWDTAKRRCNSRSESTFSTGTTTVYDSAGVIGGGGHSDSGGGQYP